MKVNFKKQRKSIKGMLLLFLGIALFATACKKEKKPGESGNTSPKITKVYLSGDDTKTAITSALPGKYIVIMGENLDNAQKVAFDSKEVTVDPMGNTATTILVQIPADAPENANGVLKVTTAKGTASFNFAVLPPPVPAPVILKISNENAVSGETVTITGENLKTVTAVKLPGGTSGTNLNINAEGTQLTYTAPDMGTTAGKLELVYTQGKVETVFNVNMNKAVDGMISNLDDRDFWANWSTTVSNDAGLFPGNRGKYVRSNLGAIGSAWNFAWWGTGEGRNASFTPGTGPTGIPVFDVGALGSERNSAAGNYALKFEVNTRLPWPDQLFLTLVTSVDKNVPDAGSQYTYATQFTPAIDEAFDTKNKWVTITIPLDKFKNQNTANTWNDPKGAAAATLGNFIDSNGQLHNLQYRFYSGNKATPATDIAFDNFRIVKIK